LLGISLAILLGWIAWGSRPRPAAALPTLAPPPAETPPGTPVALYGQAPSGAQLSVPLAELHTHPEQYLNKLVQVQGYFHEHPPTPACTPYYDLKDYWMIASRPDQSPVYFPVDSSRTGYPQNVPYKALVTLQGWFLKYTGPVGCGAGQDTSSQALSPEPQTIYYLEPDLAAIEPEPTPDPNQVRVVIVPQVVDSDFYQLGVWQISDLRLSASGELEGTVEFNVIIDRQALPSPVPELEQGLALLSSTTYQYANSGARLLEPWIHKPLVERISIPPTSASSQEAAFSLRDNFPFPPFVIHENLYLDSISFSLSWYQTHIDPNGRYVRFLSPCSGEAGKNPPVPVLVDSAPATISGCLCYHALPPTHENWLMDQLWAKTPAPTPTLRSYPVPNAYPGPPNTTGDTSGPTPGLPTAAARVQSTATPYFTATPLPIPEVCR